MAREEIKLDKSDKMFVINMAFDCVVMIFAFFMLAATFDFPLSKGFLLGFSVCLLRLSLPKWNFGWK